MKSENHWAALDRNTHRERATAYVTRVLGASATPLLLGLVRGTICLFGKDPYMKRTITALLGGILAVSLLTSSAGAGTTTSGRDPDDTRGRLDIRFVEFQRQGDEVTLTLRTYEKWRCRLLKDDTSTAQGAAEAYEDGKAAFLSWSFGTDRHGDAERTGSFRCKNGRLKFQFNRPNDVSYSARRPDRRTAKVTLPVRRFSLDDKQLRLFAASQLNGQFGNETFFDEVDHSPRLRPYKS